MSSKTCPHCQTEFTGLEVEGDEDGNYWVHLETAPCSQSGCPVEVCSYCPQDDCDGCGGTFCQKHLYEAGDLKLCAVCKAECESYQDEPPRKVPPSESPPSGSLQPEVA